MAVQVTKSPSPIFPSGRTTKIFLGGSIEMGKAIDWQTKISDTIKRIFKDSNEHYIEVINPRRDDWDSSWKQVPQRGTQFDDQVMWEQMGQDCASVKVYYFAKDTISPITLLELGKYGSSSDTIVYVDPNYERRGNVIIHCRQYGIEWCEDEHLWTQKVVGALKRHSKSG